MRRRRICNLRCTGGAATASVRVETSPELRRYQRHSRFNLLREPLQKRRPSVPPALASVIMRSLEKYPADRPQTAREMLAELDAAVTPSGATSPTGMLPARPVSASKRSKFIAAGAAVIVILLGSTGSATHVGHDAGVVDAKRQRRIYCYGKHATLGPGKVRLNVGITASRL